MTPTKPTTPTFDDNDYQGDDPSSVPDREEDDVEEKDVCDIVGNTGNYAFTHLRGELFLFHEKVNFQFKLFFQIIEFVNFSITENVAVLRQSEAYSARLPCGFLADVRRLWPQRYQDRRRVREARRRPHRLLLRPPGPN